MLKLGTFASWKWFKHTHSICYSKKIDTVMLYHLTSEDIRHYVLAELLILSWVFLIFQRLFKQTQCVTYSMKIDIVMFKFWPVNKTDTQCYLIYCVKVVCSSQLKSGLSRHTVLDITQIIIQLCFILLPVNKSDTMC